MFSRVHPACACLSQHPVVPPAAPWLRIRSQGSAQRENPRLRMRQPGRGIGWAGGVGLQLWDTRGRRSSSVWPRGSVTQPCGGWIEHRSVRPWFIWKIEVSLTSLTMMADV